LHALSVTTGGRLFDLFLENMGSYTSHRQLQKHKAMCIDAGEDSLMTEDEEAVIMNRERGSFHGYVLAATTNVGNAGKPQVFYTTFAARYHGLSRTGIDLLAFFGYAMPSTNYDKIQVEKLREYASLARYTTRHALVSLRFFRIMNPFMTGKLKMAPTLCGLTTSPSS
jgi:hypothetical protein